MKITKQSYIEIWFSTKKFMEITDTEKVFISDHNHLFDLKHRKFGPSVINGNGKMIWFNFGLLHRNDGPAGFSKSYKEWFFNDEMISEETYWNK